MQLGGQKTRAPQSHSTKTDKGAPKFANDTTYDLFISLTTVFSQNAMY